MIIIAVQQTFPYTSSHFILIITLQGDCNCFSCFRIRKANLRKPTYDHIAINTDFPVSDPVLFHGTNPITGLPNSASALLQLIVHTTNKGSF